MSDNDASIRGSELRGIVARATADERRATIRDVAAAIINAYRVVELTRLHREAAPLDEEFRKMLFDSFEQEVLSGAAKLESESIALVKAGKLKGYSVAGAAIKNAVDENTYVDIQQALRVLFPESRESNPIEEFKQSVIKVAERLHAEGIPLRLTIDDKTSYQIAALYQVPSRPKGLTERDIQQWLRKYSDEMGFTTTRIGRPSQHEEEAALVIIHEVFKKP